MAKPPARRVPSDDYVVTVDGQDYAPHAGEWIDIIPGYTVGDMLDASRFQKLLDDRGSIGDDEPEAMAEWLTRADRVLVDLAASIDRRLVGWSWTDARGRPLPTPTADVIASLTWAELNYLLRAVRGQVAEADRKNAGRPSRTTSSATASRRSRTA